MWKINIQMVPNFTDHQKQWRTLHVLLLGVELLANDSYILFSSQFFPNTWCRRREEQGGDDSSEDDEEFGSELEDEDGLDEDEDELELKSELDGGKYFCSYASLPLTVHVMFCTCLCSIFASQG